MINRFKPTIIAPPSEYFFQFIILIIDLYSKYLLKAINNNVPVIPEISIKRILLPISTLLMSILPLKKLEIKSNGIINNIIINDFLLDHFSNNCCLNNKPIEKNGKAKSVESIGNRVSIDLFFNINIEKMKIILKIMIV